MFWLLVSESEFYSLKKQIKSCDFLEVERSKQFAKNKQQNFTVQS